MEKIRYEERLTVEYEVDESLMNAKIPPMMIQILVENAVKHGISKIQEGGTLSLRVYEEDKRIHVHVENAGSLMARSSGTGIGLKNLKRRLNILYKSEASFKIRNEGRDTVIAHLTFPKTYEI